MPEVTLPYGMKMCPGFTSNYSQPDTTFACGDTSGGRRSGDPALIKAGRETCDRCSRQRKKWDEEHGAAERLKLEKQGRYTGLIEAYATDVRGGHFDYSTLFGAMSSLDALKLRGTFPPYAHGGTGSWTSEGVSAADKLNILRVLAGIPIVHPRH